MTLSKTIFFLCLAFISGIFFAPKSILLGLLLVGGLCLFLRNLNLTAFCILFFFIGAFFFHFTLYSIPENLEEPLYGRVTEKSQTGRLKRLVLKHEEGKVLLYTSASVHYDYGDILEVRGDFEKPDSDYGNYLKKEGIYHVAYYPEIEKRGNEKSFFHGVVFSLRERLRRNIRKSIPAPQSHLLEAMTLGDRSSFTANLNERLSVSGTRHITAVSGMHIIIVSTVFFYLLSFIGIGRKWSALIALFFILLFVLFVGAPASAVRAGIMGGLLLLSYSVYRKAVSFRTICFAATGMLLFNPLLISFDLGFQLSFLAVLGIVCFFKPIKSLLCIAKTELTTGFITKMKAFFRKNDKLTDILAVTLSAQISVFPLILYNFGHFPLFSVPANLLIVPLLPFIMVLGFATALSSSLLFSFPTYLLLSFVLVVINFFSSLPFAALFLYGHSSSFPFLAYGPMMWWYYNIYNQ